MTSNGPSLNDGDVDGVFQSMTTNSVSPLVTFDPAGDPKMSIIMVTFGVSTVQPRTWAGLGTASDEIADTEMIVVDNPHPTWGHAGGDLVALRTRGVQLVRPDQNLGFGGGNNLGVNRARGEFICLLNPDVIVGPGDLSRLATLAREHPDDVVAPVLLNDDGTTQEMGGRISRDGTTRPIVKESDVDAAEYASAACWVMRRARYVELGGFDPIFWPAYYEDVDFALRLAERGGTTRIDTSTRVTHAWSKHHLDRVPDTRPQHRLLKQRWKSELAKRPSLRTSTSRPKAKSTPKSRRSTTPRPSSTKTGSE